MDCNHFIEVIPKESLIYSLFRLCVYVCVCVSGWVGVCLCACPLGETNSNFLKCFYPLTSINHPYVPERLGVGVVSHTGIWLRVRNDQRIQ